MLWAIFAFENCKNVNNLILWACFGASGNLRVLLARKIRNMTLKTKAPVDCRIRMERLLFRLGWVEVLWKPPGAFRSLREPLGASGSLLELLEISGSLWEPLGASGSLWEFQGSGNLAKIAHRGPFSIIFPPGAPGSWKS